MHYKLWLFINIIYTFGVLTCFGWGIFTSDVRFSEFGGVLTVPGFLTWAILGVTWGSEDD